MQIAVDAMGGDFAPRATVQGAVTAARQLGIGLTLVGSAAAIEPEVERSGPAHLDLRIVDTPDFIGMGEAPSAALRRKPRASIRLALDLVARGEAAGVVTAGHTGAAVMAAHAALGMLPEVERPALATTIPTLRHAAVLIDSGASLGCRASHLAQFAAMGACYARVALGIESPRLGLLSIGEEESKGNEVMRDAHRLLKRDGALNFIGNVDASRLYAGEADVVVVEGMVGNVALKVSEGLVEAMERLLGREIARSAPARLGYLLSRSAFRRVRARVDYAEQGGAPLLGVRGLCIVGHGRSSARAVRNAVALAARLASAGFMSTLQRELAVPALASQPHRDS
jgi:glycerol-3-phosphate acyltransferase PlsX